MFKQNMTLGHIRQPVLLLLCVLGYMEAALLLHSRRTLNACQCLVFQRSAMLVSVSATIPGDIEPDDWSCSIK